MKRYIKFAPVIAIILVFFPIFCGKITNNGDVIFNFFNYFLHYGNGGTVITQNILFGFPVFSSVAGIWFYPLNNIFIYIFGSFSAYGLMNVFNLILAYIFTYAFFKKICQKENYAILAGTIYVFSGQCMLWSETLTNTNYYFILPAVLFFVEYVFSSQGKTKKILFTLLTGIFLGLSWLSGHVQFVVYIHTFFFIYLIFILYSRRFEINKIWFALGVCISVFLVSYIIGYPQIQSILDMQVDSARSLGVDMGSVNAGAYLPQDIVHYVLPFFNIPKIPFSNPNLYIGIAPLLLLLFGLMYWKKIEEKHFKFFSLVYMFCLIASIKYSPLSFIMHQFPLFNSFREAPRIMFIGNFALAICLPFVLKYLIDNRSNIAQRMERSIMIIKRLIVSIASLSFLATLVYLFFEENISRRIYEIFMDHSYSGISSLPKQYYENLSHGFIDSAFSHVLIYKKEMAVFIIFSILTYYLFKKFQSLNEEKFVRLFIVITILNLFVVYLGHFAFISKNTYFKESESSKFIKLNTQKDYPFRVYSLFPGSTIFNALLLECMNDDKDESFELSSKILLPNRNMDFNIDSVAGYDNFMPLRVSNLLEYIGSEQIVSHTRNDFSDPNISKKADLVSQRVNMLRSMNVRYLISHYEIKSDDMKKVLEYEVGSCKTKLYIYEIKSYWPRYFTAQKYYTDLGNDETKILDGYISRISSSTAPFIVINDPIATTSPVVKENNMYSGVEMSNPKYFYDSMSFETNQKEETILFIGNAYLKKWIATIDGVPTKIYRANYAFMAVKVPKGNHKIEFRYLVPSRIPFVYNK